MSTAQIGKVRRTISFWRQEGVYSISKVFLRILQMPDTRKLRKNKLNWNLIFPLVTLGVRVSHAVNTDSNGLLSTPERNYLGKLYNKQLTLKNVCAMKTRQGFITQNPKLRYLVAPNWSCP